MSVPDPATSAEPESAAAEPVVEPVVEPVAVEPVAAEPVVEPGAEPDAAEPVVEPGAEPAAVEPLAAEPTVDQPVVDQLAFEPAAAAPPRRLSRTATVALSVAGLLAVTAASATVTVAVGKPDRTARTTAAGPAATASASASASAAASASPSPSPTPTPTPSPTVVPRPASTLKGSVSGGKHSGDLRYFLLPVPDLADPYGSPDGTDMSMDDIAKGYSKDTDIKGILDSWGFESAATRTYRLRDGKVEVTVELKKFGRADRARGFAQNSSFKGDTFDVDGVDGAKGYIFKPEQQAYTGELVGIGYQGDICFEVTVEVKGDPDKALLADAMRRQYDRLANG